MKKRRDYLDIEILDSFINETDRGSVLIIGEWLSDLLIGLILSHMPKRDHKNKSFGDIFNVRGELGSFSSRIKISYALGLISKDTYSDLEHIREIRNEFAHSLEALDLKGERILQKLGAVRGAAVELARKCPKHDKFDDCQLTFTRKETDEEGEKVIQEGYISRQRYALLQAFTMLLKEIRARHGANAPKLSN